MGKSILANFSLDGYGEAQHRIAIEQSNRPPHSQDAANHTLSLGNVEVLKYSSHIVREPVSRTGAIEALVRKESQL